ncbi:MAG: hypothetical protein ACRDRT_15710, partial [Pseudonocardiaceae bacterium]
VALNPQPLPPGPEDIDPAQPAADVTARGTQAGIIIVSGKTPDRLDTPQKASRVSRPMPWMEELRGLR